MLFSKIFTVSKIFYYFLEHRYLIEKAKAERDWEEAVPYEKKKRGKAYTPKQTISPSTQNELIEMGFDVEFDDDVNKVCTLVTSCF